MRLVAPWPLSLVAPLVVLALLTRANDYTAELRAAAASPVLALAVAFDGKVVRAASVPVAVSP